jgi:chromate transport protein ChrA
MDEAVVRGLITGAAFMLLALAAAVIWKLLRSSSRGAQRLRWALAGMAASLVSALVVHDVGISGLLISAVVIAAAAWVIQGFRKP